MGTGPGSSGRIFMITGRCSRVQRRTTEGNIRIIEGMLYKQSAIRTAVMDYRASSGGHTGGNAGGHAFVSDPTAGEAIRNAEEISAVVLDSGDKVYRPERWIKLFDALKVWAEPDFIKRGLLKRRYAGEDYRVTCLELAISSNTYFYNLQEIRNYALALACQLQIAKIL